MNVLVTCVSCSASFLGDSVWCFRCGGCWYTLQVSSYFLLGWVYLFFGVANCNYLVLRWSTGGFFGVESTAIASRLFLWPGRFNTDQTRCVSFPGLHHCSALILFNNLQFRAINLRVLASNVQHMFCVLQSAQSQFPDSKAWPSNFDISDTSDLPLTTAFEQSQLATKTLYKVSCH